MIDRGVWSGRMLPDGIAYLLSTTDGARSVRCGIYAMIKGMLEHHACVRPKVLVEDVLRDLKDVLPYFTGKSRVEGLETLGFLPGAIADHCRSPDVLPPRTGQPEPDERLALAGGERHRQLRHGRPTLQPAAKSFRSRRW